MNEEEKNDWIGAKKVHHGDINEDGWILIKENKREQILEWKELETIFTQYK